MSGGDRKSCGFWGKERIVNRRGEGADQVGVLLGGGWGWGFFAPPVCRLPKRHVLMSHVDRKVSKSKMKRHLELSFSSSLWSRPNCLLFNFSSMTGHFFCKIQHKRTAGGGGE